MGARTRSGCHQLVLRGLADLVACGAFPHPVVGWRDLLVAIVDADPCV